MLTQTLWRSSPIRVFPVCYSDKNFVLIVCLVWFFMSQSKKIQLCWDGSSWVEPVLSKEKCVLLKDMTQLRLRPANPPLQTKNKNSSSILFRRIFTQVAIHISIHLICKKYHLPFHDRHAYMCLDARKSFFGGLRTTKAQTSLRIRADWSAPLLFALC